MGVRDRPSSASIFRISLVALKPLMFGIRWSHEDDVKPLRPEGLNAFAPVVRAHDVYTEQCQDTLGTA